MRILQLISSLDLDSTEKAALQLAVDFHNQNHETMLVALQKSPANTPESVIKQQKAKNSIRVKELVSQTNFLKSLLIPLKLKGVLRAFKPDIVHSHSCISDWALANAQCLPGKANYKIVRTINGMLTKEKLSKKEKKVERKLHEANLVFASPTIEKAFTARQKKFHLPQHSKSKIIPCGIAPVSPEQHRLTEQGVELVKDKLNICYIGNFTDQKGFDILIEGLRNLPHVMRSRMHIHIIGSGRLAGLTKDQKLSKFSTIYPPIKHIESILPFFDYLLMPSRFEGFPRMVLEAFSVGLPVVVAKSPGLIEAAPKDWELTVEPENPKDLTELIIRLINNYYDRDILASQGIQFIKENYSVEKMTIQYNELYENIMK